MAVYDEEEEGLGERVGPLVDVVRQHAKMIALAVLIVAILAAYAFLWPKPVSASVTVMALDGNALPNSEVSFEDLQGNIVGHSQITDAAGNANFEGMTPGTLVLRVKGGPNYREFHQSLDFSSGESKPVTAELEASNSLKVGALQLPSSLSSGCSDKFVLPIENQGDDAFDADLAIEGDATFNSIFSYTEGKKTILPKETLNFTINANVPTVNGDSQAVAGAIRVKTTNQKADLGFSVSQPLIPTINPAQIIYTPSSSAVNIISLTNGGKQPITNLAFRIVPEAALQAYCGADGSACFALDMLGSQQISVVGPGQKLDFGLRITLPADQSIPPGDYVAKLAVTAACMNSPGLNVPITLELRGNA